MAEEPDPHAAVGYIPWWLLAGVALLFVILAALLAGFVVVTRPADLPMPTASAQVIIVPPAQPPATATLQAPPIPDTPTPEPSPAAPPPPPGDLKIGDYVQVTGTGDAGFLNLRAEAGIGSPVNYLALEHEVLQVQAGPTVSDNFTWWYLVDPATNSRYGWAVQNYLQRVEGP